MQACSREEAGGGKRSKSVPAGFGGIFSFWLSARIAARGQGGGALEFLAQALVCLRGRGGEYCARRAKLSVVLIPPNGNAKSALRWMEPKKSELDLGTWEFWIGM